MAWQAERKITQGPYEVVIDFNDKTEERRVAVYKADVLLAVEFVKPISAIVEFALSKAANQNTGARLSAAHLDR